MATNTTTLPADDVEFQTDDVLSIAAGHFTHDTFTAFLASLLPLLIEKMSLSLTRAGFLSTLMQLPAIINPFIGYAADKISLRYFIIFAPGVSATMMSLLGIAPNYGVLTILLLITGVSSASFHAPAPAMISQISGNKVGKGMSFFMAGGELGRTLGPVIVAWAVSTWTLEGYYRVIFIGWVATAVLFWRLKDISIPKQTHGPITTLLPAFRRLFLPLAGIILFQSFLSISITIYLPTYITSRGSSLIIAGSSLAILELAGVIGALTSGTISDHFGRKPILLIAILVSSILTLLVRSTTGFWLIPLLLTLGFFALSAGPIYLVIVQDYLTTNKALGNGIYMSMSFLIRSIVILLVGIIGDNFGIESIYLVSGILSLISLPIILTLPGSTNRDR